MKFNTKNIIYSIVTCFLLTSCNDFLEEKPYSDLTNENWGTGGKDQAMVYTSGDQMENILTGAYKLYANEFWQLDWYILNEGQSDNAYAGENKMQTVELDELRISPTNAIVARDWGYIYKQISEANTIIEWLPKIDASTITQARSAEIEGEARFMRGFAYFNLVRLYGQVPLLIKYIPEISTENIDDIYPLLFLPKETQENIYAQIIQDLEIAEQKAPAYSDFKFKITKALARLILAQVYATKDGFEKTDWAKVKQYTSAVVSDTRYGLLANYDDLFAVDAAPDATKLPSLNLKHEHSKESIFEVDYSSWNTLGNWSAQMFLTLGWKKFNTPSHDLYRAFTAEGDIIRRDASIIFGDVTGSWTDNYWSTDRYPFSFKIRSQEAGNIILFRLPEAMLLLAEAENETGNLAEAKKIIDKIRDRVKLPATTATTKETMRLAIENEHRFEFAFEGKRWMDLKRRGRFIQVMKGCKDHQKLYAPRLNEDKLVWPIPQSELDLNSNLVQNPGY